MTTIDIGLSHKRRLRALWRSAGWPCLDMIEVDLLAAGLLERVHHASGHDTLRVTDAGIALLAETHGHHRRAMNAHEALVERVATEMGRAGRIVWRGLSVRAPVAGDAGRTEWVIAMPDVYSIRHTTVEDYVEPIVHEIKVSRADLLGDLRRGAKRAAYLALCSECWYVIREGIARPEEIPAECGVLVAMAQGGLAVARAAPKRAMRVPFAVWMVLARATPVDLRLDEAQPALAAIDGEDPGAGSAAARGLTPDEADGGTIASIEGSAARPGPAEAEAPEVRAISAAALQCLGRSDAT